MANGQIPIKGFESAKRKTSRAVEEPTGKEKSSVEVAVGERESGTAVAEERECCAVEVEVRENGTDERTAEENITAETEAESNGLANALKKVLEEEIPDNMTEIRELLSRADIDATNDNGIATALVLKALKGDLSAARWIRETVEEKTEEELSGKAVVIISGDDELK